MASLRTLSVALCLLSVSLLAGPAVADGTRSAPAQQAPCDTDGYTAPVVDIDRDWTRSVTDALDNESRVNWRGGQFVGAGAEGGCALFVADGDTAQFTADRVNATAGIVTGTIDLGVNGSFALVNASLAENDSGPSHDDSLVTISNDGPSFDRTIIVNVGNRSETVTLSTGRYFNFAVIGQENTTTVQLWGPTMDADESQSIRTDNTITTGPLTAQLGGEVFLDGFVTGVLEPPESESSTDDQGDYPSGDEEDDFESDPGPVSEQDPGASEDDSQPGFGSGILMILIGAAIAVFARPLATFDEATDAIGSTTKSSEVEAAAWKVLLVRIAGLGAVALGLFFIVSELLRTL